MGREVNAKVLSAFVLQLLLIVASLSCDKCSSFALSLPRRWIPPLILHVPIIALGSQIQRSQEINVQ